MSGLDSIIERIAHDSSDECERIIADGAAKSEEYRQKTEKIISDECAGILTEAKSHIDAAEKMADSSAQLKYRQSLQAAKNRIIDGTLAKALEYLNSMPEKKYFSALTSLCAKNAEAEKNGEIRFNSADLGRLPRGFEDTLNKALADKGACVSVGKLPADISGGFVLVYGDIEENCSFEAILEASSDTLRDIINEKLFF